MGAKLAKWVLSVWLAVILLLSVVPALASSPDDSDSEPPASSEFEADETQAAEIYRVTLITGDVVTVAIGADGKRSFAISPAEPERLGQHFLTIEQDGDTYIIPDGIDLQKLDIELFNIDYLVDEEYYTEPSLPLLVSHLPSLPEPAVQSLEGTIRALGQNTRRHEEVGTISTRLAYQDIVTGYSSLLSQPEVGKVWLDRKVHVRLNDSVPLIGAPSWWASGYNGTGIEIAILDTGIDSSHPALDDLDDNPATNDPKVLTNINFTDDAGFDDLYGHGTHVAGIAAGTAGNVSANWTELTQDSSPPARVRPAMIFDSSRNKVVLFGGYDGTWLGDTWEYDGANQTWAELTPASSPSARSSHAMTFDSSRNKVVLFGGYDGGTRLVDTWEYDVAVPESAIRGVAPGAWLWNVKVLNQYGYGYDSWIIDGIDYASLGPDGIESTGDEADIISMSLGGGPTDGTDPLSQAVNLAVERGVVVVVAAGNDGYGGMFTVSKPGVAEKVITVGATAKDDTLASFSGRGPTIDWQVKPEILAPGVSILSSAVTNPAAVLNDPSGYMKLSGTSMATPHVAGAAALLLQHYSGNATPQFIKDALMSTAKDLGYNVYEQGSGRLDLDWEPWPVVGVTPASLSLGLFGSENTTASGNFTFFNTDNTSHQISLSANLTDILNGEDYSANVPLSTANFTIPAGGQVAVNLSVNLTSLPTSMYSGRVMATVDGGLSRAIQAIFSFIKAREVTVHKIDINGAPAQGHPLWVIMEHPVDITLVSQAYIDASGNFTFYAIDGSYHLISPNWGYAENQTDIWTIAENVTISGEMTITLDERDTVLVDFDPNKAGQTIANKSSVLYWSTGDYSTGKWWGSSWWYPSSFLSRVSPISRFNASFTYGYYPMADFIPSGPDLVNTGEWHHLRYSTENITGNTTFVADYNNLVHRLTGYGVALNGERAGWRQYSFDDIAWLSYIFAYHMDAPQERWEWLSPDPVIYYQNYARAEPWGEWYFHSSSGSYSPGEHSRTIGGHPFTSAVDTRIWWNEPNNRLYINGHISRDSTNNYFDNLQAEFSGNITVTQDGAVVLEKGTPDYFNESVYFEGAPDFTVEVSGNTTLGLSSSSYTRLDFTASSSQDHQPPDILFQVTGANLSGVVATGEVQVKVQTKDSSSIGSIYLSYSLGDSENWTNAGSPTLVDGWYIFNLGQLQETFVSITVDATDQYGNHAQRTTNRAFYVGSPSLQVSVNAPDRVVPGANFTTSIDINEVVDLNGAQYDISFDPLVVRLDDVTPGQIGSTEMPVQGFTEVSPGVYRVLQALLAAPYTVNGSGYLAVLHFNVIGSLGDNSTIGLSNGTLSGWDGELPVTWIGDFVEVKVFPGDANIDGVVNILDLTRVVRVILLLEAETPGADANLDGVVDVLDLTKIIRIILMLEEPVPPPPVTPELPVPPYGGVFIQTLAREPQYFDEALGYISSAPTLHLTNEELLTGDWAKGPASTNETSWLYSRFPAPNALAGSLAESWEITDNQTLVFHIRPGVYFHNKPPTSGREMTADDIVFSLKRLWEIATSYHYRYYPWETHFAALDGGPWITVTDNWTVEIKSLPGKLATVYEVAGDYSKIVPPEVIAASGNMSDWQDSAGTGPFMLTDYVVGSSVTFVRNPNYWMKDPLHTANTLPYLNGVKYLIIQDKSTRMAAMRTGKIDTLEALVADDAESLMATSPELQYLGYLPASTMALFMRNDVAPFGDIRVRRAMMMAIDQQTIADAYYGSNAEILTSPIVPAADFLDMYTSLDQLPVSTRELYEYHPDKALQLLDEAGYPGPDRFATSAIAWSGEQIEMLSIIKAYWADIGVDLEIRVKELGVYSSMRAAKSYQHGVVGSMTAAVPFRFSYWRPGGGSNYSLIDDSYLNGIIADIDAAYFDETSRRQLMKNIVPYMLEQAWMLPVPEPYVYTFWQPWVKGYHGEVTTGWLNHDFPKYIWLDPGP